jgi:hypothetical protein
MWEVLDDTNAIREMLSLDTNGDLASVTHGQLSNIPVYGISYLGLVAPTSAERNPEITDGVARSGNNVLRTLASNTGGRAITDTNDPLPGIDAIFEENSSWYVIGYRPTYPLADGRYRRFQLNVSRRGASVWPANRQFEQPKPEAITKIKPVGAATDALSGLLPVGDVPLRVNLVPFARIGAVRDEAAASVAVILGTLPRAESAAAGRESLDLELRAFDGEGRRPFGIVQRHIEWPLMPGSANAGADILMSIDLKPGRYSLRLGASSPARAKSGSVYADVIVPDFVRDALSMSGLVLSRPGPERTVFAGLGRDALPIVPTTAREFARDDVVTAFIRVYQGSRARAGAVTINTRIVDAQDLFVHTSTLEVPQEQFSGLPRASDFQMRLPLSDLSAGEYLLTVEAVVGENRTTRHARFRMK